MESDDSVGFSERVLSHATVGTVIPAGDVDDGQSKLYKRTHTHTPKKKKTNKILLEEEEDDGSIRLVIHLSAEGWPSRRRRSGRNDDRAAKRSGRVHQVFGGFVQDGAVAARPKV